MSVIIDEIPLRDLGIRVKESSNIMGAPETRDNLVTIPGAPGMVDMGSTIESNYFDLACRFDSQGSNAKLQMAVDKLLRMLFDGYGNPKEFKLIFEHEPDKHYTAKYHGSMPVSKKAFFGDFNLPIIAHDPYKYTNFHSSDINWDSENITFDDYYSFDTVYTDEVKITRPQTLEVYINGYALRPTILISGSGNNVTFRTNGKSFSLKNFTNATWEINGGNYTVLKNGENTFDDMTGDFLDLLPGTNLIEVTGSNMNFEISIPIRDKFL